jgi:hypothetical protein
MEQEIRKQAIQRYRNNEKPEKSMVTVKLVMETSSLGKDQIAVKMCQADHG